MCGCFPRIHQNEIRRRRRQKCGETRTIGRVLDLCFTGRAVCVFGFIFVRCSRLFIADVRLFRLREARPPLFGRPSSPASDRGSLVSSGIHRRVPCVAKMCGVDLGARVAPAVLCNAELCGATGRCLIRGKSVLVRVKKRGLFRQKDHLPRKVAPLPTIHQPHLRR